MRTNCEDEIFSILRSERVALSLLLGTLRFNDADSNENVKKNNRSYRQNNNFARASRFFVHFFARFCTTTTWKCLIPRFMSDVTSDDKIQFLFLYSDMVPRNSTPGGFAYIWQSKWGGIISIKTERKQIHFLSDILIAVASLDLKVANDKGDRPR